MERYHIFKLGIAILFYAAYCIRPMLVDGLNVVDNDYVFYQGVEGKPGVDFPVLSHIPRTTFSCRNIDSGYYADLETDCQVFHICEEGRKISFLCPNGTIFQQSELICEWWFKVNCSEAPNLYEESAEQLREENARRKAARRRPHHGAVMRTEEHASVSAIQNGRSFNVPKKVAKEPDNDLSKSPTSDFARGNLRRKQQSLGGSTNNARKQEESTTKASQRTDSSTSSVQNTRFKSQNDYQQSEPRSRTSEKYNQHNSKVLNLNREMVPTTKAYHNQFNTKYIETSNNQGFKTKNHNLNSYNRSEVVPNRTTSQNRNTQTVPTGKTYQINQNTGFQSQNHNLNNNDRSGAISTSKASQNQNYESDLSSKTNSQNQRNQNMGIKTHNSNIYASQNQNSQTARTSNSRHSDTVSNSAQKSGFKAQNYNLNTYDRPEVVPIGKTYQINQITGSGAQNAGFQSQNHISNSKPSRDQNYENQLSIKTDQLITDDSQNQRNQNTGFETLKSNSYASQNENSQTSNYNQFNSKHSDTIGNSAQKSGFNAQVNRYDRTQVVPKTTPSHNQNYPTERSDDAQNTKFMSQNQDSNGYYQTTSNALNNNQSDRKLSTKPIDSSTSSSVVNIVQAQSTTSNSQTPKSGNANTKQSQIYYINFTNDFESGTTSTTSVPARHANEENEPSTTTVPTIQNQRHDRKLDNLEFSYGKQSTASVKNDVVSDSDETQIPQETASFYKSSRNSISTSNPYPNHRETYSELKEPKYYSTKIFSAISSVTPQYLTTQSINSGRPFIGSQVGTNLGPQPTTTIAPTSTSSTQRTVDHATVYGSFSKSTTQRPTNPTILLSKSLFGGTSSPSTKSSRGGTTSSSFYLPTTKAASSAEILTAADSYNRAIPQVRFFGTVQSSTKSSNGANSLSSTTKPSSTKFLNKVSQKVNSLSTTPTVGSTTPKPGFFVTKSVEADKSKTSRPRPFQLPIDFNLTGRAVYTTPETVKTPQATYPTYRISSASPFSGPSTIEPTQPTPFTTATPTLSSTFVNVDNMITALAEMASQNSSRPGLVVPPSVGPQTLHSLAVYFANALDGISEDKNEDHDDENEDNLTRVELEKKRLTALLTQMTMNRYNELFKEENTPTVAPRSKSDDDLEAQHSKGFAAEPPKVRQLAKVFTQALSSYLDDPSTFKKVLEEIRPTEPPALDNEPDLGEDELLNFSDADSKSYPGFFPTPPAARPTWGYLIAYNTSQDDVKNSLSPDLENLQGADSQSFVSQFNKLRESSTKSSLLPEDHWTSSPDVTKLWSSAFSFNPASINEDFDTTETITVGFEDEVDAFEPHHEVKYDLRALPQLELNSTQVHGILIDFMNTTKSDNRLQRILRKLNTTEDEFLSKMKEIEGNPLTRRLVLLLINECGSNSTKEGTKVETKVVPVHSLLGSDEILETASSGGHQEKNKKRGFQVLDPSLTDDSQDTRALQLLNSLYTIASRFGK